MRARFLLLTLLLGLPGLSAAVPPIVILVAVDGMRWDYLERHEPPHLQAFAQAGARMERLLPVTPTKTYPNHYTLVTGQRAERHGIVGNEMFDPRTGRVFQPANRAVVADPRWWEGEPIWVTAARQGRRTACMFWPGSDVEIHGHRPTYWLPYDHDKPHAERVAQVLAWLDLPAAERPSFLTLYFAAVDDAGHWFGPLAPETREALHDVDHHLGALWRGIEARGLADHVTVLIVSDHGMTEISRDRLVFLDDVLAPEDLVYDMLGPIAGLRPPPEAVERVMAGLRRLPRVRVLRKTELPAELGYTHHPRIPDVLVLADEGWEVSTRAAAAVRDWSRAKGNHGFDVGYGSMHATLIAYGARVPRGRVLPATESIHLYNLMCALLEIRPSPNDGDQRLVEALLR